MKYTFFEIDNFKGIKHVRLDFDAHPRSNIYTLVGLNESGKTTILEAIDYLGAQSNEVKTLTSSKTIKAQPDLFFKRCSRLDPLLWENDTQIFSW